MRKILYLNVTGKLLVVAGCVVAVLSTAAWGRETLNRTVASRGSEVATLSVPGGRLGEFDPLPIVAGLEKNIKGIRTLIRKEKPRRDRLALRCLQEKLKQAMGLRKEVVALIPGLAQLTAGPGGARDSLASKLTNLQIELGREAGKSLLVAARTVEKLSAEARMCQHITDGLVPRYGAELSLQGPEHLSGDDLPNLPDYSDLPPEDIMSPVSEIHNSVTP